jgi:hypothetical protein
VNTVLLRKHPQSYTPTADAAVRPDPLLFHFLIFWRLQQRVFGLKLIKNSMLMLQVQMCGCPRLICACDIGFNWECFFICVEERLKGICIGVNFCSSVAKTWRYLFEINLNWHHRRRYIFVCKRNSNERWHDSPHAAGQARTLHTLHARTT